jgi:hypothetical protein
MARLTSVDEQIKALEMALVGNSDSEDDISDGDDEEFSNVDEEELEKQQFRDNYVKEVDMKDNLVIEKDKFGNPVRIYSKTASKYEAHCNSHCSCHMVW